MFRPNWSSSGHLQDTKVKYFYVYIDMYICRYVYIDKIVKTCILMCVCIIEFVVVLFKMLSCNALSVVSVRWLYEKSEFLTMLTKGSVFCVVTYVVITSWCVLWENLNYFNMSYMHLPLHTLAFLIQFTIATVHFEKLLPAFHSCSEESL
jgi:hypothetical protein